MMSDEEKRKYGIEEIPREQFKKRAEELHISPRSIEEFENSDEEVFYYAHNFIEYEVNPSEKKPNTPKVVLIKDINTQMEFIEGRALGRYFERQFRFSVKIIFLP